MPPNNFTPQISSPSMLPPQEPHQPPAAAYGAACFKDQTDRNGVMALGAQHRLTPHHERLGHYQTAKDLLGLSFPLTE
jgi:hypothetical protein